MKKAISTMRKSLTPQTSRNMITFLADIILRHCQFNTIKKRREELGV
jgi:hypothetical protein